MKVKLIALDHEWFEGVTLPVEAHAYGLSGQSAGLVFVRGDELISLGAKEGTHEADYQDGVHPDFLVAMMIGQQVEDTPELLKALGLVRNEQPDGTMEA